MKLMNAQKKRHWSRGPELLSTLVNTSMALIIGGKSEFLSEANVTLIVGPLAITG